ncbi:MAG: cation:proton antiporter, partial [Oscillospiraceae bacterium]
SWVMQIMLFFTLGLLSFPSALPKVIGPGILLSLFMIFIARPAATFSILSWFKIPIKQQLFVSWVGLRGAASIVFAITAAASHANLGTDIFHMVFFVALFSVSVQGTLIPTIAKKLGLVEQEVSVFTTFNVTRRRALRACMNCPFRPTIPGTAKP